MTQVEITQLSKAYSPGKPVLRPLDLTVEAGELFFLLGPSGCGKSTLLRILAGLLAADRGSIRFNGREISALPPEKRQAAMVFQSYALWPHLSVFENVAFGLRTAGADAAAIRTEVESALRLVRLEDCADRRIPSLSGGQQQRVALARALAVRPALLLLDEPLSNLDARLRDEMRREIRRITKERRLTAIYVTHDRREALSMADRIAVLSEGVLQQVGTPEELYLAPANRFVASFLGDVNVLPGTVESGSGAEIAVATPAGRLVCRPRDSFAAGEPVQVLLRPESLRFAPAATENVLNAILTDGVFLGDHREWRLETADGTVLEAHESAAPHRSAGTAVRLTVAPDQVILLRNR